MDLIDLFTSEGCLSMAVALNMKGQELIDPRRSLRAVQNPAIKLLCLALSARSNGHTCLPLSAIPSVISGLNPEVELGPDAEFDAFIVELTSLNNDCKSICAAINHEVGGKDLVGTSSGLSDFVVSWSQAYQSAVIQSRAMSRLDSEIATHIRQKIALPLTGVTQADLLLPSEKLGQGQIEAILCGLNNGISVITGGAGTGKSLVITTIIRNLIAKSNPRIGVCAPTARAVRIIKERFIRGFGDPTLLKNTHFNTLHRYAGNGQVEGHETASLEYIFIDEVSMVDNELMAQLFRKLSPTARVVLVGDANQLPSVDEGSILSSLVTAFESKSEYKNRFIRLSQNFRIEGRGEADLRFEIPRQIISAKEDVQINYQKAEGRTDGLVPVDGQAPRFFSFSKDLSYAKKSQIRESIIKQYLAELAKKNPPLIICSQRNGFWGSETLNGLIMEAIEKSSQGQSGRSFPVGVPIMITRNDLKTGLANGDRGFVVDDTLGLVDFETVKQVKFSSLSYFELGFAITIHKSQGSTYDFALVVLGDTKRTLNKQLLYTALTRTSKNYAVIGSDESYNTALHRDGTRFCLIGDMIDTI